MQRPAITCTAPYDSFLGSAHTDTDPDLAVVCRAPNEDSRPEVKTRGMSPASSHCKLNQEREREREQKKEKKKERKREGGQLRRSILAAFVD